VEVSLFIGVILGFAAMLTGFTLEGGQMASLTAISPFVIVVGGTIGVTIASYSFKDIARAFQTVGKTFKEPSSNSTKQLIDRILEISKTFRTNGVVALDSIVKEPDLQKEDLLLLKEGLVLLQDGKDVEDIQYVMESELHAFAQQKAVEAGVFEAAGGYSPTMGVIGTVMSLVVVLAAGFGDSAELAHKISTAFIATLYGVGFANIIYLPIANKIKLYAKKSQIQKEIIIDGVCMMSKGMNVRSMENELSMYFQAFSDGKKHYRAGIEN
jgi:chemotaxis protein MotA